MKLRHTTLWALAVGLAILVAAPDAAAQSRKKKDEDKKDTEEQNALEGKEKTSLIGLVVVARKVAGGQWEVVVRGTTELMPDALEITLTLHYHLPTNPPRDTKTHIPIKDGQFGKEEEIVFGPYDAKAIPNGDWWVVAHFVYADQSNLEAMQKFREGFPKPEDHERFLDFSTQKDVQIGSESKERVQDGERRKHYDETIEWVLTLMDEFDRAYAAAVKSAIKDRVEWDEEIRKDELLRDEDTQKPLEGEDLKRELGEVWKEAKYVKGSGLNVDAWREFLDREEGKEVADHPLKSGGLRGRIARLYNDHTLFEKSALGGKLPKADERLRETIGGLYALTMLYSRKLYHKNGLEKDPADVTPVDPIPLFGKGSHGRILSTISVIRQEVTVFLGEKKKRR